jgi:hypothetical protein
MFKKLSIREKKIQAASVIKNSRVNQARYKWELQ